MIAADFIRTTANSFPGSSTAIFLAATKPTRNFMSFDHKLQSRTTWILRAIGWTVALSIIFTVIYKVTFRKQAERKVNCLDQAASGEHSTSPLASVEKYSKCIVGNSATAPASMPARCRYAGVWSAYRGGTIYEVTLEADGKFVAEPGQNTPPGAATITGAWGVAGRTLIWVYDSGAVWPPDINLVSAESENAFSLAEVDGATTRYTLINRQASSQCR